MGRCTSDETSGAGESLINASFRVLCTSLISKHSLEGCSKYKILSQTTLHLRILPGSTEFAHKVQNSFRVES